MKNIIYTCIFLLYASFHLSAQIKTDAISAHELVLDSVYSPAIQQHKKFYALLPADYREKSYPILYLLHGAWGNYRNWIEMTQITSYIQGLPLIVIFPDADNSFYINSPNKKEWRYTDYLLQDLFAKVEFTYQADTLRRGIAGLSMGGYGAFYLATYQPQRFVFCGGLSSAFSVPGDGKNIWKEEDLKGRVGKLLLDPFGMPDEDIHSSLYPPAIAQRLASDKPLPYFYFVHGIQDGYRDFLPAHRTITSTFSARNIAYEYHEVPGKHDWAFWDKHILPLVKRYLQVCHE